MGRFAATVLFLTVLAAVCPPMLAQDSGMQASLLDYILPQYREKDNHLQFVLFGEKAMNSGALIYLDGAKIDILQNEVGTLEHANIFIPSRGQKIPDAYVVDASQSIRRAFWSNPKQKTVRAWIYTDKAVFDKANGILRSDGPAFFRSREIDVDGVGFDAYHEKKFIHIRSKVRVVIRPELRNQSDPGRRE